MTIEPRDLADEDLTAEELADAASPYHAPEAEALLDRAIQLLEDAKPMPLSSSWRVDKDTLLDILEEAIDRLPDELRAARWLLKERDEYLAKVRREGEDLLDAARSRTEQMVQRTEVVKAAEHRARQIVESAEAEARRLRHETEDFCDQKLASFEIVLHRVVKTVENGRMKLQAMPMERGEPYEEREYDEIDDDVIGPPVFDQDL